MVAALNATVGHSTRKLVLVAFANHAHKDGTAAWCSADTVAEYVECDDRTVRRHVAVLLEQGWLREGDQRLVQHLPANKRPVVYDVAMNEQQRQEWQNAAQESPRRAAARLTGSAGGRTTAQRKAQVSGPDRMSPRSGAPAVGLSSVQPGLSSGALGPVTRDRQTVPEPSREPSSTSTDGTAAPPVGELVLVAATPPNPVSPGIAAARAWWCRQQPRPLGKGAWHALQNVCLAAGERGWTAEQIEAALDRTGGVPSATQLDRALRQTPAGRSTTDERVAQGLSLVEKYRRLEADGTRQLGAAQ